MRFERGASRIVSTERVTLVPEHASGHPSPRIVPRLNLGGTEVARLILGGWQLSEGHRIEGPAVDEPVLFSELAAAARRGWDTFDCADIYVGVEELFGRFHAFAGPDLRADGVRLRFHTKYVPDLSDLGRLRPRDVEQVIDRSLRRLRTERLDLVQFSWWDYTVPRYVEVCGWLGDLVRAGKIRALGVTNFDTPRMEELLDAGMPLVSNQVQYSLLDRRPERAMVQLATDRGFTLICYGALGGGLLTERALGQPQPGEPFATRSLAKYLRIAEEFGGWDGFQELLGALDAIAIRHRCSIAAVALRWLLDREAVGACLVGLRSATHLEANERAVSIELTSAEQEQLQQLLQHRPGPRGEPFELERDPQGVHGRLMWRDLHRRQAGDRSRPRAPER